MSVPAAAGATAGCSAPAACQAETGELQPPRGCAGADPALWRLGRGFGRQIWHAVCNLAVELWHRDRQKGTVDFWGWIFQGSPRHLGHAGGPLAAPRAHGQCGRQQGAGVARHKAVLSTAGCSNVGTCLGRACGCDARSAGMWQTREVCREIARELSHGHKERRKPALRAGSCPPTQVGQHGPCSTFPLPGTRPPHCPTRHLLQLAVLWHNILSDKRTFSSCL